MTIQATSQLKGFLLPSRWMYVTYQAHAALLLQLLEAASPWLMISLAEASGYTSHLLRA